MNSDKTKKLNSRGRPAFYKTPEALQAAVDRYFDSCKGTPVFDRNGAPVMLRAGVQKKIGEIPPTISGLAAALGFADRHTFSAQAKRGTAWLEVVRYGRLRIEASAEERLYDPQSYRGAAFVLENCFGWNASKEQPAVFPKVQIKIVDLVDTPADDPPEPEQGKQIPAHNARIDLLN